MIEEFVSRFAQEFIEVDTNDITKDTDFNSLEEWSSMQALIIIAMIDEEYNVTLNAEDIKQANTIRDLYDIVSSRLK